MRILLVFHGWFPTPGRPVAGGALRAWHHAEALRAAGHDVHAVTRTQDAVPGGPPGFATGGELRAHAERIQPDVLLVVQPEEAPDLAPLGIPMVVDLYAPRMLEAQFQDATGIEAVNTLRAIRAGDFFLFSNHRQRFYFLGLLALAGVDLRSHEFGAVVPLVAPKGPERSRPRGALFVMGGVSWPWIDPTVALGRAVAHLKKRRKGKLLVLGHKPVLGDSPVRDLKAALPPGKRLEYGGVLPYDELLATYAGATAALDMMAPTPERDLAVAFRHMDYLGCGLPMIVGDDHVLAEPLRAAGAGLVGLPVEDAIDAVLDDPDGHEQRAAAARELALARFGREVCVAPLLAWLSDPVRRTRRDTPLGSLAEVSARAARAERGEQAAAADLRRVVAEVEAKRGEVAGLVQQSRVLSVATERLAGSVAEVAGFKREAIAVLGGAQARAREELSALQARSAALEADVAKKGSELEAALREKDLIQDRMQDLRKQLAGADARVQVLRTERDAAVEAREVAQADALKKSGEIDTQARQQELMRGQIGSLERRLDAADRAAAALRTQLAAAEVAQADARADSQKKSVEIDAFAGNQDLQRERIGSLERRLDAGDKAAATLREQIAALESALAEARADSQKKSVEVDALVREKAAIAAHLEQVQRTERGLGAEAARLGTELAQLAAGLAEAQRDGSKKSAELQAMTRERDLLRERLPALEDRLTAALQEAKAAKSEARRLGTALAVADADGEKKGAELETLAAEARQARSEQHATASQLAAAQADAAKKTAEQDALQLALDQARAESQAQAAALLDARADAAKKLAESQALQRTVDHLRTRAEAQLSELQDAQADAAKKAAELEALEATARERSTQLEGAQRSIDELRSAVAEGVAALHDAQSDGARKSAEILAQQQRLEQQRQRVEASASDLVAAQADATHKAAEIDGLQRTLGRLRTRAEADATALRDARADAAKKAAEIEAQQHSLEQLRPRAEADATALKEALAEASRRAAENESLQASLDALRPRAEADAKALRDLRADAAKKAAEIEAMQHGLEQLRPQAEADATALKEALAAAAYKAAELAAAQQAMADLRPAAEAAAAASQDARADAAKKAAEIEALQLVLAQERRGAEAGQAELVELRASSVRSGAELSIAQQQLDQARGEVEALRRTVADAAEDAAAKGAQVAALQSQIEMLEGRAASTVARAEALREKLEEQAAAIARADESRGTLQARFEAVQASLADTQADIEKKNSELEAAWAERERLEAIIADLRSSRR